MFFWNNRTTNKHREISLTSPHLITVVISCELYGAEGNLRSGLLGYNSKGGAFSWHRNWPWHEASLVGHTEMVVVLCGLCCMILLLRAGQQLDMYLLYRLYWRLLLFLAIDVCYCHFAPWLLLILIKTVRSPLPILGLFHKQKDWLCMVLPFKR